MGESYGSSALTVYTLKSLVQRPRPGSTPGTGNGTHSFPSGHSASAFGSATLIQRNSGWLAGAPVYGLAAFTAFERVEAGRHYPSDIFAGAAIGSLSSGIFDSLHWGSGEGRGIARQLTDVKVGFEDRLHGAHLEVGFGF
jgi:membrane-associated phospholipid phosphatase